MTLRHPHADRGHDLYETDPSATLGMMRVTRLPRVIWEPCCGRGAIANVLRGYGHEVVCSDLVDYGIDPTARYGVDFFDVTEPPAGVQALVTNPPYKYLNRFIERALSFGLPDVLLLAPSARTGSEGRNKVLGPGSGLYRVLFFIERLPMMHRDGWTGKRSSSQQNFAWFHWRHGHRGKAAIERISCRDLSPLAPLLGRPGRPSNGSQPRNRSLKRGLNKAYLCARLRRDGRPDLAEALMFGELTVRAAYAAVKSDRS